jgi:tetratricopeptide (TPR) repeat protein
VRNWSRILLSLALLLPLSARADYAFVPTDSEFYSWPEYCKAVYTRTGIGKTTKFVRMVTATQQDESNALLGSELYGSGGIHHFCTGAIWLNRAALEPDGPQRDFMLGSALDETAYTQTRIERDAPLFADVYAQMARILYEVDRYPEALEMLDIAISAAPQNSIGYTVKGILYYKQGQFENAREVLQSGDEALKGKSPEIHYNLGLVLLKLNRPEEALVHAKKAYALGYPLPGLKRKLEVAGVWH